MFELRVTGMCWSVSQLSQGNSWFQSCTWLGFNSAGLFNVSWSCLRHSWMHRKVGGLKNRAEEKQKWTVSGLLWVEKCHWTEGTVKLSQSLNTALSTVSSVWVSALVTKLYQKRLNVWLTSETPPGWHSVWKGQQIPGPSYQLNYSSSHTAWVVDSLANQSSLSLLPMWPF